MVNNTLKLVEALDDQADHDTVDPSKPAQLIDYVPEYEKIDGWLKIEEAELLFETAKTIKSGCIVEVGSYRGRSTVALAAGSRSGGQAPIFAIEPHELFIGVNGGAFGPNDRRAFFRTLLQTKLFRMVRLLNTTSSVVAPGWDKPIALLFIDGDHRYESVYSDFTNWRPFLMRDALVIFNNANGAGPSQLIKEMLAEGCLTPVTSKGRLAVHRFRALQNDIDAGSIQHGDVPAIYPALVATSSAEAHGQNMNTISHCVYYGGEGSYLYQPIPKCGCTSIKTILLHFEKLPVSPDEWSRHNKQRNGFPGIERFPLATQREIIDGKTETFKFVFVRDPYTRMASVYSDKILNGYKKGSRYWIDLIKSAAKEQNFTLSDKITFEEFVQVVSAQPIEDMDPHWRLQHYEGRFGIINFDFVGHFEKMSSDLLYVLERLQAPEDLMRMSARPHNVTGASIAIWSQVSAEVRAAFLKTYAIDFDTLRYPFRYQYSWQ